MSRTTRRSRAFDQSFRFLSISIALLALGGCVLGYHRDWSVRLVTTGCVFDSKTSAPVPGANVTIESDRIVGPGRCETIGQSNASGQISIVYEGRWGCYQSAFAVWRGRVPDVKIKIILVKDGYQPEELQFSLDRHSGLCGDVPINLGTVRLRKTSGN